jgi:hypothetical protein
MTAGVRRCRSRPCCVFGLQGPSRPQELCAGTLPGHDAGRCGTAAVAEAARQGNRWAGGQRNRSHPAVRDQAFSCPWLAGSRGARTCSGRRRPQMCLAARIRWSAAYDSVEGERSVKPSAQPTLVRTQHLPPPAKTAPWLRKRTRGAVLLRVTPRITVCHGVSICRGVHGRIADGVRTGRAVGDTVGFPRTATDGPGKGPCPGPRFGIGAMRRPAADIASEGRAPRRRNGERCGDRAICCPGRERAARALARGVHPGRLSRNVIYTADRRSRIRAERTAD